MVEERNKEELLHKLKQVEQELFMLQMCDDYNDDKISQLKKEYQVLCDALNIECEMLP